MNRALFAAASGMAAQSSNLEIIAHNLANAGVDGFKGDVATFAAVEGPDGTGFGTVLAGSRPTFEPGKLVKSGGAFDVAIDGVGFFCVCDGRGRAGLTRAGSFERAADGSLRNASGWRLTGVRVPADALALEVGEDGSVVARTQSGKHACGAIRLATVDAPERLHSEDGTIFRATGDAGRVRAVRAGVADGPRILFGTLEQSNVSIVEAMMEILAAQRAYEANAKGVQAADEMLRIANNLNRG